MRADPLIDPSTPPDAWLEMLCRQIEAAGRELALAVGGVNQRLEEAGAGESSRKPRVTESMLRRAQQACTVLHQAQVEVQEALFDCEHEIRSLRERDVSPAELLVDGERLIAQYRFFRRRARIIDGLLAYLPVVSTHASTCLQHLRRVRDGGRLEGTLAVPDCGFALVALEQLSEQDILR